MCKILEDMRNEAEERGVKIGEARGVKKAQLQNASRMIADGLDLTIVAKYSGLTLSQVKELAGTVQA